MRTAAINDINPAIRLGEDGIDSVLVTLHAIRARALSASFILPPSYLLDNVHIHTACRTCVYALHAELTRVLEVQHAFRALSLFDVRARARLTVQLTRIALGLPHALEAALAAECPPTGEGAPALLPRRVAALVRGVDGALARMERILK